MSVTTGSSVCGLHLTSLALLRGRAELGMTNPWEQQKNDDKKNGSSVRVRFSDESPIAEVLNVAYAAHELSADGFDEDMKWLEDRRKDAVAERKKRAAEGENERAREAKPTIPERPTE